MTEIDRTKEKAPATGGMKNASLTLGIIGIIMAIYIPALGVVLGIAGLILGMVSARSANMNHRKQGAASGGITTSVIAIVLGCLMFFTPIMYQNTVNNAEQRLQQNQ